MVTPPYSANHDINKPRFTLLCDEGFKALCNQSLESKLWKPDLLFTIDRRVGIPIHHLLLLVGMESNHCCADCRAKLKLFSVIRHNLSHLLLSGKSWKCRLENRGNHRILFAKILTNWPSLVATVQCWATVVSISPSFLFFGHLSFKDATENVLENIIMILYIKVRIEHFIATKLLHWKISFKNQCDISNLLDGVFAKSN